MKKVVVLILVLFMIMSSTGCNKAAEKKPTLANALEIFNDMSASYDDKLYPYEFTEAELAAADEETKSLAKSL